MIKTTTLTEDDRSLLGFALRQGISGWQEAANLDIKDDPTGVFHRIAATLRDQVRRGEQLADLIEDATEVSLDIEADDLDDEPEGNDMCDVCKRSGVEIVGINPFGDTICVDCDAELTKESEGNG